MDRWRKPAMNLATCRPGAGGAVGAFPGMSFRKAAPSAVSGPPPEGSTWHPPHALPVRDAYSSVAGAGAGAQTADRSAKSAARAAFIAAASRGTPAGRRFRGASPDAVGKRRPEEEPEVILLLPGVELTPARHVLPGEPP